MSPIGINSLRPHRPALSAGAAQTVTDGGAPSPPRTGTFELPREADQRRLLAPAGDEVRPDRKPRRRPVQRHGDRGLAGCVADPGVGREPSAAPAELERVASIVDESAELDRRLAEGGRQPDVEPIEIYGHVAHCALHVLDREQVLVRAERAPALRERPYERLEVIGLRGPAGAPLPVGNGPCSAGRDQGGERGPTASSASEFGTHLFDVVTERLAQRRCVAHRTFALGIGRVAERGLGRESDLQRPRRPIDFIGVRPRGRRGEVRVSDCRAGDRIEQRGGVAHAARHPELADEAGEQVAVVGPEGNPPPARLQAHQPAAGGGNTDRASGVVAVRHRHHAGRDRRRRAAAGATGGSRGIPRVAGGAEQTRLGGRPDRELRGVRLADKHEPRGAKSTHQLAVLGRHVVAQERACLGEAHALDLGEEVLHEERHPGEDSGAGMGTRGVARMVVHLGHDRVEGPVDLLGPIDRGIDEFERRQLAAAYQRRTSRRVQAGEFAVPDSHPPPSSSVNVPDTPPHPLSLTGSSSVADEIPLLHRPVSRRCTSSTCPSS